MKPSSKEYVLFCGMFLLAAMIGCRQRDSNGIGFPRDKTLYLAGYQWGDPNTFNPLCDWPAWPVRGGHNVMYEPLVLFNTLTGDFEPLLARLDERSPAVVSVLMDPRARWSDGRPLTAADVLFTYRIGRRFANAPTAYVWDFISRITVDTVSDASDNGYGGTVERVRFRVSEKRDNPLVITDFLTSITIKPRHVFEPLLERHGGDLSAVQKERLDKHPVVSGPYNLSSYSGEKIVLKRRDDYWGTDALHGGRPPKPEYIVHPIYKSNDHFSIALQQGNLDVSGTFIPRIWLKARKGVRTWYDKEPFHVPASIPMLVVNVTHYPLSDRSVRRAIAHAINYRDIRELAVSGYSTPLQSGLILPFGTEKEYFSSEDARTFGVSYDPDKAKSIMAEAGYTPVWKGDGKLDYVTNAAGERVPTVYVRSPAGWTDWESIVRIAVKGMREAGIDVREGFIDAGVYWQSLPAGDFDMIMHTPAATVTPSLPWSRFEAVMSSRNWEPEGERMNENQGRYNKPGGEGYNAAVDSLLKLIPTLHDEREKKRAYRALNVIFMKDQPTIPLVYRPEQFYEFSIRNWTNFPSSENPYAPPQLPCYGAGSRALWEIVLAKSK
ncbi:MAG: ABC transporter substrate-binding protein [Chitinivibrionales bacterium]|nr:ABC transporter substrate-binding protein [Chitinivibrionales bacterium]MBD3397049.1 ABC transporter substrate-binding protein [Chitinivibrionales bacterium]